MKEPSDRDLDEIFKKYNMVCEDHHILHGLFDGEVKSAEDLSLEFDQFPTEFDMVGDGLETNVSLLDYLHKNDLSSSLQEIEDIIVAASPDTETIAGNQESNDRDEKRSFSYNFCKRLLEVYNFKCCNDQMYVYNHSHGIFKHLGDSKLKILIRQGWNENVQAKLNKNTVLEVIERLKTEPYIQVDEDYFNCYPHLMNFWNGVLNLATDEFLKHSSEYRFTHCIQADYTDSPRGGKTFRKFIKTAMQGNEEKERHLQEVIGYMLSEYTTAKKAFMLIGQPHSGKSTLNKVISTLIGSEHVANVPLHRLHERFILAHLSTKKVNICSEISDATLSNI